jgi:pimeloyl-ACP methyl ester carboxylesterase
MPTLIILFQTRFFSQKSDYQVQSTVAAREKHASSFQCVTYDNRGCGRSSAPVTFHYSTTQMAKDALALIDHLQWGHCHVVGISMGGMIALEFALLAPERILSLSLLATHAGGLAGRAPIAGVADILRSMSMRDAHSLTENTLTMLYGVKTLANPDRRKVRASSFLANMDSTIAIAFRASTISTPNGSNNAFHSL